MSQDCGATANAHGFGGGRLHMLPAEDGKKETETDLAVRPTWLTHRKRDLGGRSRYDWSGEEGANLNRLWEECVVSFWNTKVFFFWI